MKSILIFCFNILLAINVNAIPPGNRQSLPRVIVIGGGIAGLTAGKRLHNIGFNVTLLEAMDRIGGRTYTLKMDNGQHIEVGGEWIHGEVLNSIFELVNPLGLLKETPQSKSRLPREFGDQFGFQTGEMLNMTLGNTLRELLEYMWFDPEDWGSDLETDVSMGEWARFVLNRFNEVHPIHSDNVFIEAVYDWAHRITNAEDAADDWFEKSATDEGEQYEWLEGFENIPWLPPYSFASLHQLILTGDVTEDGLYDLPEWIKLNTEVILIQYSTQTNTVNVTTRDGTVYTAEHVIFTPSLGVLKEKHLELFQPPLSQKKQQAIEDIGFGAVTKYGLEFETPWWPEGYEGVFLLWNDHNYTNISLNYWRPDITKEELLEEYDGLPLWTRSILNIFTVDSGSAPNIIRVWMTGNPSRLLDDMEPAYVQENVMAVIHKFLDRTFPNITEPIRTYQSKWTSNPFTRGVYSYRTMASEENDVWATDLAEPILQSITLQPLIGFAGEATHANYFSTAHGAYDTGIREFMRIFAWHASASGNKTT